MTPGRYKILGCFGGGEEVVMGQGSPVRVRAFQIALRKGAGFQQVESGEGVEGGGTGVKKG